jgi:hypothetical protein
MTLASDANASDANELKRLLRKLSMLTDDLESMIAAGSAGKTDLVYIYDQVDEARRLILTFLKKGEENA